MISCLKTSPYLINTTDLSANGLPYSNHLYSLSSSLGSSTSLIFKGAKLENLLTETLSSSCALRESFFIIFASIRQRNFAALTSAILEKQPGLCFVAWQFTWHAASFPGPFISRPEQGTNKMASSSPFLLRLMSSSVAIANRAGRIIRSIMKTGNLGVVDKVNWKKNVNYFEA